MEDTVLTEEFAPEETTREIPRKKLRAEHILAIIAGALALAVVVLFLVFRPSPPVEEPVDDPQQLLQGGHAVTIPTVPETQTPANQEIQDFPFSTVPPSSHPLEETQPPEPELEPNPYGKLDFQYEGRYLGCLKAETMAGVDVSLYQGHIDWEKVKASGIEFAMIRVGYRGYGQEGRLVEDQLFTENIKGALDAGLKVGIYFFSQAITAEEAVEEAEFVLERIQDYEITMPVVYDWEYISQEARTANTDSRTLTDCYLAFCAEIEAAGYTPMVYFNTYQSMHMMHLEELDQYPFWLALYSDRMTYPYRIDMWQYTCTGYVPGINVYVDINLYFTDEFF